MRQSRRAAQLIQSADCFTGNLKRFWFAHNKWIIHSYSHELHYFPLEPLALIIGSAGASLTELILLRSLFTLKLLAAFLAVIFAMAMIAGYATYLFF